MVNHHPVGVCCLFVDSRYMSECVSLISVLDFIQSHGYPSILDILQSWIFYRSGYLPVLDILLSWIFPYPGYSVLNICVSWIFWIFCFVWLAWP